MLGRGSKETRGTLAAGAILLFASLLYLTRTEQAAVPDQAEELVAGTRATTASLPPGAELGPVPEGPARELVQASAREEARSVSIGRLDLDAIPEVRPAPTRTPDASTRFDDPDFFVDLLESRLGETRWEIRFWFQRSSGAMDDVRATVLLPSSTAAAAKHGETIQGWTARLDRRGVAGLADHRSGLPRHSSAQGDLDDRRVKRASRLPRPRKPGADSRRRLAEPPPAMKKRRARGLSAAGPVTRQGCRTAGRVSRAARPVAARGGAPSGHVQL